MPGSYETSIHRSSRPSEESLTSNYIRRVGSDVSDDLSSVNYLANHLKQTASFDYNKSRNSYHPSDGSSCDKENNNNVHVYEDDEDEDSVALDRASLEVNYSRAMNQMNRGDYGPVRQKPKPVEQRASKGSSGHSRGQSSSSHSRGHNRTSSASSSSKHDEMILRQAAAAQNLMPSQYGSRPSQYGTSSIRPYMDRRQSQSTAATSAAMSTASTSKPVPIEIKKRSVSTKDPSEETIAVFGCYGVTGRYFLQRAIEAGYNVKAMILPGMLMEDMDGCRNLQLIYGTLEEIERIREVVDGATYVVCLLNDCDHENFQPPIGNCSSDTNGVVPPYYDFNNLNFVHNLVPILEESVTCRVMLYETSALSKGNNGSAPLMSKIVKKMGVSKTWRETKKEQDQIVDYITHQSKNAHFNYIITRPSGSIWDKPSRKKLAASKSQPGPFPITNTDLAEFTLNALKMEKVYNSCPYVVQDGI